jgi:O-methyltransferase involved in polyketide biosynthesis
MTDLRTDVAHSARVYDYLLGGSNNYPPDRAAAEQAAAGWPALPTSMRQNRLFVQRVGRYLAGTEGVRQFLDVGSGIPTSPNLHEVVGDAATVLYVDNDPVVLAEGRSLLATQGATNVRYLDADMRDPETILPTLAEVFDLDAPIALSIVAVLQFVPDQTAYDVVRRLVEPLPSGSFLALSMVTADHDPTVLDAANAYTARGMHTTVRTHEQIEKFSSGLELLEPGVTLIHRWRPDGPPISDTDVAMSGGVARKP